MIEKLKTFAGDLWFDLRERKLVPVLIALAAAVVAIPVLLGGSSETPVPSSAPPVDVVETQPAVALAAEDGIRTAAERLAGREAKNPFRQQLQSLPSKGEVTEAGGQVTTGTGIDQPAAPIPDPASPVSAPAAVDSNGAVVEPDDKPVKTKIRTKTRTIVKLEQRSADLRFGKLGARNRIEGADSLDVLPRSGDPVLVMLGVDDETGRATFDLASRVISVWGKGSCAPARDECDYLSLKPGESAKLRYDPRGEQTEPIVYSLSLLDVRTKRING